jgi:hypothetical protein
MTHHLCAATPNGFMIIRGFCFPYLLNSTFAA